MIRGLEEHARRFVHDLKGARHANAITFAQSDATAEEFFSNGAEGAHAEFASIVFNDQGAPSDFFVITIVAEGLGDTADDAFVTKVHGGGDGADGDGGYVAVHGHKMEAYHAGEGDEKGEVPEDTEGNAFWDSGAAVGATIIGAHEAVTTWADGALSGGLSEVVHGG